MRKMDDFVKVYQGRTFNEGIIDRNGDGGTG